MNRKMLVRDFIIANMAVGFGALIVFAGIVMQEKGVLPKLPCTFLHVTHVYCPGCGGSRALLSLLGGGLKASLLYNPAVIFGVLLVLYYEAGVITTLIKNDGRYYFLTKPWPIYIYIAIIIVFAVVRDVLFVSFGIDFIKIAGTF